MPVPFETVSGSGSITATGSVVEPDERAGSSGQLSGQSATDATTSDKAAADKRHTAVLRETTPNTPAPTGEATPWRLHSGR